ncbi:hypothetical protein [Xanthomonas cannabis]|nr:hypothetical protein [Xanthomonas cannabis]
MSLSSLVAESDQLGQIIELVRQLPEGQQDELAKHLLALAASPPSKAEKE